MLAQNDSPRLGGVGAAGAKSDEFVEVMPSQNVKVLGKSKLAANTIVFEGVKIRAAVTSVGGQDLGEKGEDPPSLPRMSDVPGHASSGVGSIRLYGASFAAEVLVRVLNNSKHVYSLEVGYVQNIMDSPVHSIYRSGVKETIAITKFTQLPILDTEDATLSGFAELPTDLSTAVAGPILVPTSDRPNVRVPFNGEAKNISGGKTDLGKLSRVEGSRTFTLTFRVRNFLTGNHLDLLRITIKTSYDVALDASGQIVTKSRKVSATPISSQVIKRGDPPAVDTGPLAVRSEVTVLPPGKLPH